jgi:hypothetical protein
MNDFRRRLAGDGPVELVLHGLEKLHALRLRGVVINAGVFRVSVVPVTCSDESSRRDAGSHSRA